MKKLVLMVVAGFMMMSVGMAQGAVLTFEGLVSNDLIPNGYGGFDWSNMYATDATVLNPSGYLNGLISGTNVAFNAFGNLAVTSSSGAFNFNGAYLTAAWNDGLSVQVDGYLNSSMIYSTTVVTSAFTPAFYTFNYQGVDQLVFTSFGGTHVPEFVGSGTHFAMDNFTYNERGAITPEPSTFLLLGAGLGGLALLRRKAKK